MPWEVEQKFKVADLEVVQAALESIGGRTGDAVTQADHYFNHPSRDFVQSDEALRIRQQGDANFVTYKGPKIDQSTKTREEIEVPLAGGKVWIAHYRSLLEALGFRYVMTVRKTRRPVAVTWAGMSFEVALDRVEQLGQFVELETIAEESGLDAARTAMQRLAERLNLGLAERRGYADLLAERFRPSVQ